MRTPMLVVVTLLLMPGVCRSQAVEISLPGNLILPNYDRVGVGQDEGLEGGAFIARTNNSLASWYNPAGLAQVASSQIQASATAYEQTNLDLEGLTVGATGSRLASISSFVGGVPGEPILHSDNVRLGFSITTPIQWSPGTIEGSSQSVTSGTANDFGITTEVDLSRMIPAVSAGFRVARALRLGAGVGVAVTSLTQRQSIVIREASPLSARTAVRSVTSDGSAWDLVVNGGAQWDLGPNVTLGARAASPGMHLLGSSKLTVEAGSYSGSEYSDVVFRDQDAEFEYRIPAEAGLGAGVRFPRGEAEVDVTYHGSTDPYALYSSNMLGVSTTTAGGGTTVSELRFAPRENQWRSVVDFAVGGHYVLNERVRLHAGFYTDTSPVADAASSFFKKMDLVGWTGGVSLHGGKFAGSLGLGYSAGKSETQHVTDPTTGLTTETQLKVQSLRLAYAVSFTF